MKPNWKILAPILIVFLLAFTFWYGGDAPALRGWSVNEPTPSTSAPAPSTAPPTTEPEVTPTQSAEVTTAPETTHPPETEPVPSTSAEPTAPPSAEAPPETTQVPEQSPSPMNPEDAVISDVALSCTLTIQCNSILQNLDWLDGDKVSLVPEDGVIFATKTVTFYEGESVFNLLVREMKRNKIHLEFSNPPLYQSAYIEGISNLYAFDCGEQSGWMYTVNGWAPNYGSSRYALQDGDVVEWVYTCDLGADVNSST